ncbi:hypothetical protein [Paraglaciecola marina]|uniref:hypothetical protein n=1 Tax=Paraglaciecola marina TaxID=2500157 RepID=UPI0014153060|nr:hypothetical protein [Paraglaciecola marina]
MALRAVFLCASKGEGVSKKSGTPKPYNFSYVEYLVPAENFIQGDHNIQKNGFEVKQIEMVNSQEVFQKFNQVKPLTEVELFLNANPKDPSKNIVTDVKKLA